MTSLECDGRPVAALEVAESLRARSRGLLGRDGLDGAILLRPAKSVHTIRMRFAIDVAFCDRGLKVIDTVTMARNRPGRIRLRVRMASAVPSAPCATGSRAPRRPTAVQRSTCRAPRRWR